jgi:EpsI family protein
MKPHFKGAILMVFMLASAGLTLVIKPTHRLADQKPAVTLENVIPTSFGNWREIKHSTQQIVNPQEQQMLNELYSQTLSKTFINPAGYRVMLSIAYGGDQSRDLGVHRPEVCYVAQGFQLLSKEKVLLRIGDMKVPAMRMQTRLGSRNEPVTYWIRVGDKIVRGNIELGFARLFYGVQGQIADGLLFRVSSIDTDSTTAFVIQEKFASDLANAVQEADRPSILGAARLLSKQ